MLPYLLSVLDVPGEGGSHILYFIKISPSLQQQNPPFCPVRMKFFHLNGVGSCSNVVVWQVWGKGLMKLFSLENKHWFPGRWKNLHPFFLFLEEMTSFQIYDSGIEFSSYGLFSDFASYFLLIL